MLAGDWIVTMTSSGHSSNVMNYAGIIYWLVLRPKSATVCAAVRLGNAGTSLTHLLLYLPCSTRLARLSVKHWGQNGWIYPSFNPLDAYFVDFLPWQ